MKNILDTYSPSEEITTLYTDAMIFEAFAQIIGEEVTAYERKILEKHQWTMAPAYVEDNQKENPPVILNPDEAYLLRYEDFAVYIDLCRKEADKRWNGEFYLPRSCPKFTTRHFANRVARKTVDQFMAEIGLYGDKRSEDVICSNNGLEKYKRLKEITFTILTRKIDTKISLSPESLIERFIFRKTVYEEND